MIPLAEAQARLLALAHVTGRDMIPSDAALARTLAADVRAPFDSPAFDASTMDGYAVRTADLQSTLVLDVKGESRPGRVPEALAANAACRIFTGAMMPSGADAVIMQEEARVDGARVTFQARPDANAFIRKRGDDLKEGDVALGVGILIGPAQCSLLASLDVREVVVAKRPVVAILGTGDELRASGTSAREGTIAESNGVALAAMVTRAGGIVTSHTLVRDDPDETLLEVRSKLDAADVLVTVGGVSVGEHDYVKDALARAGVTIDFWRVAIKPGKPLAVGSKEGKLVLGLPGNPASAMVTFGLFGVPLLRAMCGNTGPLPTSVRARLRTKAVHKKGRLELARAILSREQNDLVIDLLPHQASGSVLGMARANALACLPLEQDDVAQGTIVDTYPFAELCL